MNYIFVAIQVTRELLFSVSSHYFQFSNDGFFLVFILK